MLKVDDILKDVGVLKEFSFDEKKELLEKYIDYRTTYTNSYYRQTLQNCKLSPVKRQPNVYHLRDKVK